MTKLKALLPKVYKLNVTKYKKIQLILKPTKITYNNIAVKFVQTINTQQN